jgi:predicted RNA-binding protein with PIN domain
LATVSHLWVIDGMNLIGSRPDRWWNDPDRAMQRMAETLGEFARRTGDPVVLVFDRRPADFQPPPGLEVVFASRKGRNAADHEIERLVMRSGEPHHLRVVTSDKRLAATVRRSGAKVVSSGAFRERLDT